LLLLKVARHSGVEGPGTIDYFSGRRRWSALEYPGRIFATGPKAYKYSVPVRCRIGIKSFLAFKNNDISYTPITIIGYRARRRIYTIQTLNQVTKEAYNKGYSPTLWRTLILRSLESLSLQDLIIGPGAFRSNDF
jgi:hypothetical protein